MASALPTFPRLVFTVFEPISLAAGFLGAVINPDWFISEQISPATVTSLPAPPSDNDRLVALQLGNIYLLMAMVGLAVLGSTSEVKVVRNYLVALWIADLGHIYTRANRGAADQLDDTARAARLTRRRAGADNHTERALPTARSTKAKEKQVAVSSSNPNDSEDEVDDEELEEEIVARGEPVARFGAPRGVTVRSISPPPQSESDIGSQSVTGTQRYGNPHLAQYTRFSSIPRPADSSAPRGQESQTQEPLLEEIVDDKPEEDRRQGTDLDDAVEIREAALDSLWSTTESLANLLFNPKTESRAWKSLLTIHRRNWFNIQTLFTDEDQELLIDLPKVLGALDEQFHSKGRVIIAAANATALQNELLKIAQRSGDPLALCKRILQRLDQDFPAPFLLNLPENAFEVITNELIELGLDIRTQRLAMELRDLPNNDDMLPVNHAAPLFCAVEDFVDPKEALRHGPYEAVCGGVESSLVAQRAKDILRLIENKTSVEAATALDEEYPFVANDGGGLSIKLSQWTRGIIRGAHEFFMEVSAEPSRASSPAESLASSARREFVRKDVHDNLMSRSTVHHLAMLSRQQRPSRLTHSPSLTPTPQRTTIVREEDGEAALQASPTPATSTAVVAADDNVYDPGDQDDDDDDVDDNDILKIIRNKSRPPQSSATAPQSSAPRPQQRSGFTPVNGVKRVHDSQSQVSDDFELDAREPDPQRREQLDRDRQNMPPPSQRPQKRQRLPSRPSPPPASSSRAPPPSSSSSRREENGTSPSPSPSSSLISGDFSFSQIREQNRLPPSRPPGTQQRTPWSDADTRRLIRLIDAHDCSWSKIAKRQDPNNRIGEPGPEDKEDCVFDVPRDQQAIRDKARNVKVDLLKADLCLYPGFNNIALGKKERSALIARGKNPDRREEDVDIEGVPINTRYIPEDGESYP
ncbi:myb DNA-binding domain-containing protein [Colletotrichum truncatum]|uniref:Myb DNA-binding domain-containing protein n=1 Tax=Colletotrichum truncatum TaxID=5467 RepID=A0ACC3Z0S9_COLTU